MKEKDSIIEEMCESLKISLIDMDENDTDYNNEATLSRNTKATIRVGEMLINIKIGLKKFKSFYQSDIL